MVSGLELCVLKGSTVARSLKTSARAQKAEDAVSTHNDRVYAVDTCGVRLR